MPLEQRELQLVDSLTRTSASNRIRWLNANLTLQSRRLFHECVTTPGEESRTKLEKMKSCYWTFASDIMFLFFEPQVRDSNIFPYSYLLGFFSVIKQILDEDTFTKVVNFGVPTDKVADSQEIISLEGMMSYLIGDRSSVLPAIEPSFEVIKQLAHEGKIQYVFGNVSNGNLDAAIITQIAGLPFENYHLYQYSRKAMKDWRKSPGFTVLDSELEGIGNNDGICLVDGFCSSGVSVEQSILGFRNRKFRGPFHVYVSKGAIPETQGIQTRVLQPHGNFPGDFVNTPNILEVL